MKRSLASILVLLAGLAAGLSAQKIGSTSYITADGSAVRMEKTWAGTGVSQAFSEDNAPAPAGRILFKIAWRSGIKAASREIRLKNAKGALVEKLFPDRPSKALPAGRYSAEAAIDFGEWGTVRFSLSELEVKPAPRTLPAAGKKASPRASTTTVSLEFNLPLVRISKKPAALKGLARYEALTWWAPSKLNGSGYAGRAWLLPPGVKDLKKRTKPVEGAERWGTVKPGRYDIFLSVDLGRAGRSYDVRISGARLLANHEHRLDLVMNGASLRVTGETVPQAVRFYPAGTAAARRTPERAPERELFGIEGPAAASVCPPGVYDILYDYGRGGRNEWRPGVKLEVGASVELDSAPAPVKIISFDQGDPRTEAGLRAPGDSYFASDDELLAAFSRANRFDGDFVPARLLATDAGGGSYEVERVSDGEKMRTPFAVTRSRPARNSDLRPDMLVIFRVMDEYGRRGNDRWLLGLVKDGAAKGEVVLLRHKHDAKPSLENVKIELIRVIEEPVFKFKLEGTNYLRVR